MLNVLFTILYILLFLVCLSILIIVHELGHLLMAKAFKVYCLEYSIGMGPLIWKHKRKNGETQFSLRAIPFGGYVSMYGEGVELPEGVTVDSSRSLTGIKKWKRAIILVAGVTMNAILALVIFMINNAGFEQAKFVYINEVSVVEDSKAYNSGIRNEDILSFNASFNSQDTILLGTTIKEGEVETYTTTICTLNYKNGETQDVGVGLTPIQSFKNPVFIYTLFAIEDSNVISTEVIQLNDEMSSVDLNLKTKKDGVITDHLLNVEINEGKLEDFGLNIYVNRFRYTFGEAVKQSFVDFGRSSTAIVDSIVGLFSGRVDPSQFSGIIGIGFEAKNILDNLGVPMFIYLWGLIAVNLAIINLLPFPGLDGWQLLVLIVEAIAHKKIPEKVQSVVSFIGISLLLLLMVVIVFKDLWVYVFKGLMGLLVL